MVRQAVATFGQVDILVNNAGVTRRAYIMDLTEEDWDRIHRVNAKGVFSAATRGAGNDSMPPWSHHQHRLAIAGKAMPGPPTRPTRPARGR